MTNKQPEWFEPEKAAWILLRKSCPEAVDKFSRDAYQRPKSFDLSTAELAAMKGAIDQFQRGLRSGTIGARGVFNEQGLPVPIEASEFVDRYLDIWKRELDCSIGGYPKRVYRNVHINRGDVVALASGTAPARRRFLRKVTQQDYEERAKSIYHQTKKWPTIDEDKRWACDCGVTRKRWREFRKTHRSKLDNPTSKTAPKSSTA